MVVAVGFEPTNHEGPDLQSGGFNQTHPHYHLAGPMGLEPI